MGMATKKNIFTIQISTIFLKIYNDNLIGLERKSMASKALLIESKMYLKKNVLVNLFS